MCLDTVLSRACGVTELLEIVGHLRTFFQERVPLSTLGNVLSRIDAALLLPMPTPPGRAGGRAGERAGVMASCGTADSGEGSEEKEDTAGQPGKRAKKVARYDTTACVPTATAARLDTVGEDRARGKISLDMAEIVVEQMRRRSERIIALTLRPKRYAVGDRVWVQFNNGKMERLPGTVVSMGPSSSDITYVDGRLESAVHFSRIVRRKGEIKIVGSGESSGGSAKTTATGGGWGGGVLSIHHKGTAPPSSPGLSMGDRVVRGSTWQWDDQDGGPGCEGTVTNVTTGMGQGQKKGSGQDWAVQINVQWDLDPNLEGEQFYRGG